MKKIALSLFVVLMAVSFLTVGCSKKQMDTTPEPAPAPAPAPAPEPAPMPTSDNPSADVKKAGIAVECGQYQMAIDLTTAVINTSGVSAMDMAKAYNYRGLAYFWLKDYQSAISDFSDAIGQIDNYGAAYYNRGMSYMKAGDMAMANDDFAMAKKLGYWDPANKGRAWCPTM